MSQLEITIQEDGTIVTKNKQKGKGCMKDKVALALEEIGTVISKKKTGDYFKEDDAQNTLSVKA